MNLSIWTSLRYNYNLHNKIINMKPRIIKALIIFSCVGLLACKSEDVPTDNVGQVVNVFELKYGEPYEIVVDNNKYNFSLKKVVDNVGCTEAIDFVDNEKALLGIRVHAYLQVNGNDKLLEVQSVPGGTAFNYLNNGTDVKDIQNTIDKFKSTSLTLNDSTYFNQAFINVFGAGSVIRSTTLKVFIAKANLNKCQQPNATVEQYKFILIITKQPE